MAVQRDHPYGRCNFLVDLGTGETGGPDAGFATCSAIGMEVAVAEYRNGNDRENVPRRLTGLMRVPDVTLERGMIGTLTLFALVRAVRDGDQGARTVTITLLDEERAPVLVWRLLRARCVRYAAGPLDARSDAVAIESLTLACEALEVE